MRLSLMRAVRIALCLPSAIIIGCDGATSVLSPRESASFSQSNGSGAYSLSVTALSPNSVALAWADLSSNETGYEVQRSSTGATGQFAVVATIGANSTSFRDDGLAATSSYCYRVASWRSTGRKVNYSAFSDVACATTKLAPPANAHAATGSSTSATLTWTGGAGTAAGFRVERAASESGPWASVATTPGTTTTFTDPGRTPEEQVCYRVIGLTSSEETNPSNTACMAPLAAPSNLAASASADGVELTWQDNSSLEFTYVVEQSTDGVSFSLLASVPGNVTSYHVVGVTSAARWYRVRAQRADVASDFSNTASATGGCVPTGDEVCDNGRDDDCDGYADGGDPDCGELVDCNANECGSGTICNGQYCVSSCTDGYRDSDESDVDCGGGCGSICQVGQHCWGSYDCASNVCVYQPGAFQGVCQAPVRQP